MKSVRRNSLNLREISVLAAEDCECEFFATLPNPQGQPVNRAFRNFLVFSNPPERIRCHEYLGASAFTRIVVSSY